MAYFARIPVTPRSTADLTVPPRRVVSDIPRKSTSAEVDP